MQALVDMEIFQLITLYDLQALCSKEVPVESDGSVLSMAAVRLIQIPTIIKQFKPIFIQYIFSLGNLCP